MSNFSHRGYEHRTSGYGRRRRKSLGFRRKSAGAKAAGFIAVIIFIAVAIAMVFVFFKYLKPFVNSFKFADSDSDSDIEVVNIIETEDVPIIASPDTPAPEGSYDIVDRKVFVTGGSGYVMFKGIDSTAVNYAAVLNSIVTSADSNVKFYNMVIPTNTEFGLPQEFRTDTNSQKDNLDVISSSLMDNIINIDVHNALDSCKSEYIYYRTDENLTSLGAYYAFLKFAAAADIKSGDIYTLDELSKKKGTVDLFWGSLLERTTDRILQPNGNPELFANADYIEFYKPPIKYSCYEVFDTKSDTSRQTEVFTTKNSEQDPLSVFPSHNTALIRLYNDESDSTEKLLIIKDSSAEPMVGYFLPYYKEVHVADSQLYKENLNDYINNRGITQVLFVSSITNANNSLYCQRLRDLFDKGITG